MLTPFGTACLALVALYCLAVLAQGLFLAAGGQVWQSVAAIPLIVLTHIVYGLGFWRGLFTLLKPPHQRPPVDVALETILIRET
jgi:hypothetical protein